LRLRGRLIDAVGLGRQREFSGTTPTHLAIARDSAASVARPRLFAIDARLSFLLKSCAMAGAKKIK
jgi:hypothetical protein